MKTTAKYIIGPLFLIGLYGAWGIRWGLPSAARTDLFLPQAQRTPEFFDQVSKARDDLYAKMGGNAVAYFGRLARAGQMNNLPTMLNSYSSYLIKSHSIDESATMVMLSKINPLKNRWYPYSFVYGGAYLYPAGVFLGGVHVLHLVRLVSSPLYYFTHPEGMAGLYTALRLWSLFGLLIAACAIFYLGDSLLGRSAALWAMLFFGLSPTCLAHTKFAKPHTWAGALSLWALYWALKAKKNPTQECCLVGASCLLGLAMGMTVTQVVFLPFLFWAAWSGDWRASGRRALLIPFFVGGVFVVTNAYLLTHVRDYLDEKYFLAQFSPFAVHASAVAVFFTSLLRVSMGWELWILAMAGFLWALIQKSNTTWRQMAVLLLLVIVYVSFQTQKQNGLPLNSRLFLGLIGLLCIAAAGVTGQCGRLGQIARWACLAALLVKGAVYDAHFASDKAPFDNASLAAQWVMAHVPAKSLIGQPFGVPLVDSFPPIPFTQYRVVSFQSEEFLKAKGPVYAIVSPEGQDWTSMLSERHFSLVKRFSESPLQKLGFRDPFTLANFSIDIYARN